MGVELVLLMNLQGFLTSCLVIIYTTLSFRLSSHAFVISPSYATCQVCPDKSQCSHKDRHQILEQ